MARIIIINPQVREAKGIPDMENWYSKIYDKKDVTDPFVDVKLGKARYSSVINAMFGYNKAFLYRIAKTAVIFNDLNPKWNETFKVLGVIYMKLNIVDCYLASYII